MVTPVRNNLDHPWSLAFLPDGSMLVTERAGRLRHLSADGSVMSSAISGVPAGIFVSNQKADPPLQAGLFDVVLDPGFATNRRVYLSYVEGNAEASGVAVWRAELSADMRSLVNGRQIYRQTPKVNGERNYGGRLLFDASGALLVTLGDRFETSARDLAQDPNKGVGKIARITTEGTPAPGNPYAAGGGAPEMWSIGHRNPQGLAIQPGTGLLWEAEHGPQGGDEINLVQPGVNYGWPLISYGCEYGATPVDSCTPVGAATAAPGLQQPLSWWVPLSIAPGGISFYTGDKFPEWQGSLLVAALKDQALWRLTVSGTTITGRERLFGDLGKRLRDVRQGPDGWLYLLTDEDNGQILRVQR